MNFRYVFNQLFALLFVLSAVLVSLEIIFFVAGWFKHLDVNRDARMALFITGGTGIILCFFCWLSTRPKSKQLGRREALLLVALSWIVGAGFCALPFFIWAHLSESVATDHPFTSFIDCYFESMSGLTTTGATVLGNAPNDIESLPHSLLLWRAFTHWIGGLGIVVLFVAVLPSLGVGGKKLYRVEAPGPSPEGVTPHIRETARVLWYIYLGLTVFQIIALMFTGMNFFDSVCHTFATLATGGFSTQNASVGAYSKLASTLVFIVFMFFAGMNFNLFFNLLRGRWKSVLKDTELRVYLILLIVGTTIITFSIISTGTNLEMTTGQILKPTFNNVLRESAFTAVSIQTTTGFCSSNFNKWPFAAQATLVLLMFVGGCAGSTAGGIKVIRIWVVFKIMLSEIERVFRPQVVRPVRIGGSTIDPDLKLSTIAYVLGIVILFVVGTGVVMMLEYSFGDGTCDYATASGASVATLCTIGPGLARVGAIENYGWLSQQTKIALSLMMVIGRLEVFAILVLFTPHFWRGD